MKKIKLRNKKDVLSVVTRAYKGEIFGFAGFGVYGFGGTKKGIIKASELKGRNLKESPPVCLPSWEFFQEATDWEKLTKDRFSIKKIKRLFQKIYKLYPYHFIMPLKNKKRLLNNFLFPKIISSGNKRVSVYAFMQTGVDPHLQNLIYLFEKKCNSPLFATSANKSGEKTTTQAKQFKSLFPDVPILEDPLMEKIMVDYPSHTMFNLINLSEGKIEIIRKGSVSPKLLEHILREFGLDKKVAILESFNIKTLTGKYVKNHLHLTQLTKLLYNRGQ